MIPTKFEPHFPCYAVFSDDCRMPILMECTDGEKALAVFTDSDLLLRFRETDSGSVGPAIMFEKKEQVALYLSALPSDVRHIAFDPEAKTGRATFVSVPEYLGKLFKKAQ